MTLKNKIGLITGLTLAFVLVLEAAYSYFFLLPSFKQIEDDFAVTNVSRVKEALKKEPEYLSSKLSDWSNWDDTYKYVVDKNEEFVTSNIQDISLKNLGSDYIFIIDKEGNVVYKKGYDGSAGQPILSFDGWDTHLTQNGILVGDDQVPKSGVIRVGQVPIFFASQSILTSNGDGPSRGTIIFAKVLSEEKLADIANAVKLKFSVKNIDQTGMLIESGVKIVNTSSKVLNAYSAVKDYYGNDSVLLDVELPRDITVRGAGVVMWQLLFLLGSGVLMVIVMTISLNLLVIKRIDNFNNDISRVTTEKSLQEKVEVSGNDEISYMAGKVNEMLGELAAASNSLSSEQNKSIAYLKVAGVMFVGIDSRGVVNMVNDKTKSVLGATRDDEVVGKSWFDTFIPVKYREEMKRKFEEIVSGGGKLDEYLENMVLTLSGKERLVAWHNTVITDKAGDIVGTVSAGEDITDKQGELSKIVKQAEDLRRINETMVGRELRMMELKKEIDRLKKLVGEK